jgi:hypothetical protein
METNKDLLNLSTAVRLSVQCQCVYVYVCIRLVLRICTRVSGHAWCCAARSSAIAVLLACCYGDGALQQQ